MIAHAPPRAQPPYVPTMSVGSVLPDVPLLDQYGRALSLRSSATTSIVSFAYTRCTDERTCSLVTAKFARLQALLATSNIRLIEVTLDPENDRPAILLRYARASGAIAGRWSFATGTVPDVSALAQRFGIVARRGANGTIGHTEAVAILSPGGAIQSVIDGDDWPADGVAAQARSDAGLASDPLSRFAVGLFARAGAFCGSSGAGGLPPVVAIALFASIVLVLAVALRTVAASLFNGS